MMDSYSLIFDPDARAVAEFMQSNIQASRLVTVALGVASIAPLLWGRHPSEEVQILSLEFNDDDDDEPIVEASVGREPQASSV